MLMSQQRPDRIKQMLHYLWQHRHLSNHVNKLIELLAMQRQPCAGFHYVASRYPGSGSRHGCIDFDDKVRTEDKDHVFDVA